MDGTIKYCVVKKYKGVFMRKHKSNTHLLLIPVPPKKYMYLVLVGQLTEEEDTYIAQLLARIQEEDMEQLVIGEYEYFGDRFVEVESIKCHTKNPSPGKYIVSLAKKGFNVKSDLEIDYQVEYSTVQKRMYSIKGDLNLITGEISEKDIKMAAAKQSAFMGDKERFEEFKKIRPKNRRIKYYHD